MINIKHSLDYSQIQNNMKSRNNFIKNAKQRFKIKLEKLKTNPMLIVSKTQAQRYLFFLSIHDKLACILVREAIG